jgi:hypothetical protein
MMSAAHSHVAFDDLLRYWLGELDAAHEAELETHWFGCVECAERLEQVAALAAGVRAAYAQGMVSAVVTRGFVTGLEQRGIHVREYRVPRDGSVECTVTAADQVLLGRLDVPLVGVSRVDLVIATDGEHRLTDVPFDAESGEILLAPSVQRLRALPSHREHVTVYAVEADEERVLGTYVFNHTAPA